MMLLGTSFILVLQVVVKSISGTMQRSEFERNFTQKTKLRDILWLSHVTLPILGKPHTLYYVLNIFSATNLFSLWNISGRCSSMAKDSKFPGPRSIQKPCKLLSPFSCYLPFTFWVLIISIWSPKKLHEEPFLAFPNS